MRLGTDKKQSYKYIVLIFWVALAASIAALIIHFTGESAPVSTETSKDFLRKLLNFFSIDFTEEMITANNHYIRKAAHFILFFAFGVCITSAMNYQRTLPKIPVSLGIGLAFAIVDEVRQAFVPGRGPGVKDVLLDFSGVAVGVALVSAIEMLWSKHKSRKKTTE